MTASRKITHAAVGVIQRADDMVLLAQRPEGKPWSGYWEFPGGKVETGEMPKQALVRELKEELGITATNAYPWMTRTFDYPAKMNEAGEMTSEAKTVKLYFFVVTAWDGEPKGLENQQFCWQSPDQMTVSPMLPANTPIFDALKLPRVLGINCDNEVSGLNGVVAHFSAQALMALSAKPIDGLSGATCHDQQALAKAADLQLDYVVLSIPAQDHWKIWGEMVASYSLPVYFATTAAYPHGLQANELDAARALGAHGLALSCTAE